MQKKVTEKEIKRVIREYIERVFKSFETHKCSLTDELIDCPACGRLSSIESRTCLWRDCHFRFPDELLPPTPQELRAFFDRKKTEERIDKFLNS